MKAKRRVFLRALVATAALWKRPAFGTTHDGRSYAIDAALPELEHKEKPFRMRQKWWRGYLHNGRSVLIPVQLYKRNEYWFWAGLSEEDNHVNVHIYDDTGSIAESESWQRGNVAGAHITTQKSGTYYVRITVTRAPVGERSEWAVIYGYR